MKNRQTIHPSLRREDLFKLFVAFSLLQFLSSCADFPSKKISIDKDFYLTKIERGYAFSPTVIDLEFFERRTILPDKSLGKIFIHWEAGANSVRVHYDSISTLYKVLVSHSSTILLDTAVDFRKEFEMDIKPHIK